MDRAEDLYFSQKQELKVKNVLMDLKHAAFRFTKL